MHRGLTVFFHLTLFLLLTSCGSPYNDSNAVPYVDSMDPFIGTWTLTYYTDGKQESTLDLQKHGGWMQATFDGNLVFPEMLGDKKMEFRVEEEPRKYFEGTIMGNRWWGTMKFAKGPYKNQRIQWEGAKASH